MAENLTQVNSYQDKLLEAMSIVSSQLISSIPYDKTITCTIINDEEKDKGKYQVTNGEATFDAYSSDTKFKKEDVVYVTIPEGNYDNQKIIQGKKTSDNEKPFVFTTPEDTILDLTNNLVNRTTLPNYKLETMPVGLKANKTNGDQKLITKNIFTISNLENEKFIGYTRLLLKADFQSWVSEAISGDYGLRVTVTDKLNTTTTDEHGVDNITQTKTMLLNCSDMYGNPYNFENFYEQQIVFDISDLNTITSISVDFYQLGGSFYDIEKNPLPFFVETVVQDDGTEQQVDLPDDLFVTNLHISLGYDVSEITDELIVPIINDSMTYSEYRESKLNKKKIDLRWVHQFEDGAKVVKPESDFYGNNPRLKDCEIRWYRYRLGAAAADGYCGVYWTKLYVKKQEDKYLLSSESLGESTPEEKEKEKRALENVIFSPDVSYQTEQIKAIIYLNGVAIRGPIITFENEQSTTGKDVENFLNALEIECVDGTLGNYLIYNEAGNILNTADSQEERKLVCNFANTGDLAKSNLLLNSSKGDEISWKIPIQNSMIKLQGYGIKKEEGEKEELRYYPSYPDYDINGNSIGYDETEKEEYYVVADNDDTKPVYTQGNYVIIQGAAAFWNDTILYPTYKISSLYSMYNMNNTIACTIRKDRTIYTTEKEFTFGVSGTMGSDKSLVVDFVGGHTAIMKNSGEAYSLQVKMYDENNKPVDLNGVRIKWSWFTPGGEDEEVSSAVSFNGGAQAEVYEPVIDLTIDDKSLNLSNTDQIYIAKVVVGEEGAELETYFPIPIKSSEEYSHIEGATSVIYLSNGEPDYYKGDYKLYETIDDTIGSPIVEVTKKSVTWTVISQETDKEFVADINKTTIGGVTTYKGLKPISVYTEGVKNYAVVAKIGGVAVWQQPILVIRNQYPSRVINKWDGKTLTMDKETGTILSTAIAAGRKDSNTFTGVMIGDWTASVSDNSLTQATGVFGFHQGAMCYAFMDNGKAFIGKNGEGRIDFNGNNGKIYSHTGAGMEIDLDDGLITSERLSLRAGFNGISSTNYIILDTDNKTAKLPSHNSIPNQHGQYPFEIGKHFKADYLGNIYAASGKIGAWKFLPTGGTTAYDQTEKKDVTESLPTGVSAGSLYSGSTPSQWDSIILDPVKNEITGGKFRASILEATTGTIKLGGYIKVYDHTKTKIVDSKSEIDYTSTDTGGGTLGFMTADFGGSQEDVNGVTQASPAGIGMQYSGGGIVKATSDNAGMSYSPYYVSLQKEKAVMRGAQARLLLIDTKFTDGNGKEEPARASLGYGKQYVACYSSGGVSLGGASITSEGTSKVSMIAPTIEAKMRSTSGGTLKITSEKVTNEGALDTSYNVLEITRQTMKIGKKGSEGIPENTQTVSIYGELQVDKEGILVKTGGSLHIGLSSFNQTITGETTTRTSGLYVNDNSKFKGNVEFIGTNNSIVFNNAYGTTSFNSNLIEFNKTVDCNNTFNCNSTINCNNTFNCNGSIIKFNSKATQTGIKAQFA